MAKLKVDFDIDAITEAVTSEAKDIASKQSYEVSCPNCHQEFSCKSGINTCPHCNEKVELNLTFDESWD